MKKRFLKAENFSLTHKAICIFFFIIYLPIIIVCLIWYQYSSTVSKNALLREIDAISDILMTQYQNKINELYLIGDIVSANSTLLRYLEQSDSMSVFDSYLYTSTEIGPFLSSVKQANCNIETLRIYALSENMARYQNYIYSLDVLKDTAPYPSLTQMAYDEALLMPSALLFSYQNEQNQFQLCYPVNVSSNPRTFSLFTYLHSPVNHQPIAYLECVIEADVLFDASNVHLDIEQVFIVEKGSGVIYRKNDKDQISDEISALFHQTQPFEKLSACQSVIDGQEYLLFAYPLDQPDAALVVACSTDDVYGQSSMEYFLLFFSLLFFLLLFCICLWVSYKHIFMRLDLLIHRMNKLRDGDGEVAFDDLRGDVIGQVNATLSRLLNTIYTVKLAENEAVCSFLRAQIEPHFLFNALESIRMTAALEHAPKASDALMALGALMRVRIRNRPHCTLAEELSFVQNYVQLENLRFNGRIHLQVQIETNCAQVQIPALMLQPLVENAVKHGMPQDQAPLAVKIHALILPPNQLMIRVVDNGLGIAPAQLKKIQAKLTACSSPASGTQGVALSNIFQRLKLYYDDQAQLTIFSQEGIGTQITVVLPVTNITDMDGVSSSMQSPDPRNERRTGNP